MTILEFQSRSARMMNHDQEVSCKTAAHKVIHKKLKNGSQKSAVEEQS